MGITKLYRRTGDGLEYWENWTRGDVTVVHWGRVGERGEKLELGPVEFAQDMGKKIHELHDFHEIPEDEHALLLVVVPVEEVPRDLDELEALWDRLEGWLNEELGWTGLGHCDGVDKSNEMVAMGLVVDADLAVSVLAGSAVARELPPGTVIAVREDGRDVVRWPPERAGEEAQL